jgi:hypothetical protein
MRISELLDRPVVDAVGRRIGRVRDVRVIADGPVQHPSGARALRVDGLVVGRTLGGDRLGYGRTVHGPRLLAALFDKIRSHQHYVPWADIHRTGHTIVLTVSAADLRPPG